MHERASEELQQSIALLVSWRGGAGIDVISVRHNGLSIAYDERWTEVDRTSARIHYAVPPSTRHEVRAVFSFIGDIRTHLELRCLVDGAAVGEPVRSDHVEHRWEIGGSW